MLNILHLQRLYSVDLLLQVFLPAHVGFSLVFNLALEYSHSG